MESFCQKLLPWFVLVLVCACFEGHLLMQCVSGSDPDGPGKKGLLPVSALSPVLPRHPRGRYLRLSQGLHQVRLACLSVSFINHLLVTVTVPSGNSARSSPDDQLDLVTLEPDSVSFMEALLAKGHGEATQQNGFCPATLQGEHTDAPEGGGTAIRPGGENNTEKKNSITAGLTCPVTLNKAVLLYPEVPPKCLSFCLCL